MVSLVCPEMVVSISCVYDFLGIGDDVLVVLIIIVAIVVMLVFQCTKCLFIR